MKVRLTQDYVFWFWEDAIEGENYEEFKTGSVGEVEGDLVKFERFQFPLEFIDGLYEIENESSR